MAEKKFLSWVGFKDQSESPSETQTTPEAAMTGSQSNVARIRELENQLAELRSRRDLTSLTKEEFEAIKLHPTRGHDIVRDIRFLDEALAGIYHHHERIDGLGYPSGLKGDQIPEFARMIAVADAFDSMTSTRSYRSARSVDEAMDELLICRGTQFDPQMVDALIFAVSQVGWEPAKPPTADELIAQQGGPVFDDDDPLVAEPRAVAIGEQRAESESVQRQDGVRP